MNSSRLQVQCYGIVQGVGFRPFVYSLAKNLDLTGFVKNVTSHVDIEVQGKDLYLEKFLLYLRSELPKGAKIKNIQVEQANLQNDSKFEILLSSCNSDAVSVILPDAAICDECLVEIKDSTNRRYMYPFTACTLCGPRYSLSQSMPFDRKNLTINTFKQCEDCLGEYSNPSDRRFHSQTNACPQCGPEYEVSIKEISTRIKEGHVVASKTTSGFHIFVRADNKKAIQQLRERKKRLVKPFAVMAKLNWIEKHLNVSEYERELLKSSAAAIVLIKGKAPVASNVAPGFHELGVMLPSTGFHHMLMDQLDIPVVATSGNITDEPICFENKKARSLPADYIFVHNLKLERGLDDSVIKVAGKRKILIRRSRGMVPEPLPQVSEGQSLALGGQLKNTFALNTERGVFLSLPHGDLENYDSLNCFENELNRIPEYLNVEPKNVICDLHPEYETTLKARNMNIPMFQVQHHVAHVLGCAFENNVEPPFLGVAWDGSGWGQDSTLWGGEFFEVKSYKEVSRIAHFPTLPLLGGDRAAREPRRCALAMLLETLGEKTWGQAWVLNNFTSDEIKFWKNYKPKYYTSSVGRILDGVAALLNICSHGSFEGEAAMKLEGYFQKETAAFKNTGLDWKPWVLEILSGGDAEMLASQFMQSLVQSINYISNKHGLERIVLSGGVFQNREIVLQLPHCLIHKNVPPNDSGLCLGQLVAQTYETRLRCV